MNKKPTNDWIVDLILEWKEIFRERKNLHSFIQIFFDQERVMKLFDSRIWNLLLSQKKKVSKSHLFLTNKSLVIRDSRIKNVVKRIQSVVKNVLRGGIFFVVVIFLFCISNLNRVEKKNMYLREFLYLPMNLIGSREEPSNIHRLVVSLLNPQKGKAWYGSCFVDETEIIWVLPRNQKFVLQRWRNQIVKKGDFLCNETIAGIEISFKENNRKFLSNFIQVKNSSQLKGFSDQSIDHLLSEEIEEFLGNPTRSIHSFFSAIWSELYLGSSAAERFTKEKGRAFWKRKPGVSFVPFRQRLEHKELVNLFKIIPYLQKTVSIHPISGDMVPKEKSNAEERFAEMVNLFILLITEPNLVYRRRFAFSIDSYRLDQRKFLNEIFDRNVSNRFFLMNRNLEDGILKDSIGKDTQNYRAIMKSTINQQLSNWTKSQKKWFDPRTQRSRNWYPDTYSKWSKELLSIREDFLGYLSSNQEKLQVVFNQLRLVFNQLRLVFDQLRLDFDQLRLDFDQLRLDFDQLRLDFDQLRFYINEFLDSIYSEEININITIYKILQYVRLKWPAARLFFDKFFSNFFDKSLGFFGKSLGFFGKFLYLLHLRFSVHIGNIAIHSSEMYISELKDPKSLKALGVQIVLLKKLKPFFLNDHNTSQRLDTSQGSKLLINEKKIFPFLFNEISKWMIDSLMNGRKSFDNTDSYLSFIPHDRDNWLNPVKIFHKSSTISAFYKAHQLRLMNDLHHFWFLVSSNKKFPFFVEKTSLNNEDLTYREFLDISFIHNKRFSLSHKKHFFCSLFRIEPQISDIKIPKDPDFPQSGDKRDNLFKCFMDKFYKYKFYEKFNNKFSRSFIFPNPIQSDAVVYRAGSSMAKIQFDPAVSKASSSIAEPIQIELGPGTTTDFSKPIRGKADRAGFRFSSSSPFFFVVHPPYTVFVYREWDLDWDWIWNRFDSKVKNLYQYLSRNSNMECESDSCSDKSSGKKEKFSLFRFRNKKRFLNKRNIEITVRNNFYNIRLYEGERQENLLRLNWSIRTDWLLTVFLTNGFKQLRYLLSEIFSYYLVPTLVSKIDDIMDIPWLILEKILMKLILISDKILSHWLVQLRRIFHIFYLLYSNPLKKQNHSEKKECPPFLSCSFSVFSSVSFSSISYRNESLKAPFGGGLSQRSDELLFSIPFLLLVFGYLACKSLIFIFQVLRELQRNLEKIKSLTNSSYIMELQQLLDRYPIPSFRSENSLQVFFEEYIKEFIYFLIELEWLPSEANPDFSDLSTSEILSRHPKEESENRNLIDLLIPYLRSLIPKTFIDGITFLINTRHLSRTSIEIYSLIRKREKVVNGDFMDDRIESWVANTDWIDDEEREFLIQLSTLRTEKRIDQILWSLTHSNLLYEIVEQPGSNYLRYLFDMQKKDLLNYEFNRSCLAERRVFLAYYETIISRGSLHLPSRLNPFSLRLASYSSKSILVIGSIGIGRSYLVKSLAKNSYLPFIKIYPLKYPYLFDESSFNRNQDLDLDIENLEDFKNEGITYIPFDLDDFDVDDSGDIDNNLNLDKKLFNMTRDTLTSNDPFFFDMTVQLDLAKTMSPCIIWIPNIHDLDLNELRYLSLHLEESSLSNSKDRERCFTRNIIVIASTHIPRQVDPALIGLNKFNTFIKIRRLTIPQQRQYFHILSYTRGLVLENKIFDSKKFGSITMSSNARHLVALNNEVLSISITQRKYIIEDTYPIRLAFFRQTWDFQTHIRWVQDHRIFLYQIGRAFAQNAFLSNFPIDPISIYIKDPIAKNRIWNSYSYKWYVELETDLNKITILLYLLSCSAGLVTQDLWSSPGPDAKNWITSSEFLENDSHLVQSLLELEDVLVGSLWIKKNCSETLLLRSEPRNPLDMMQQKSFSIRYRRLRYEIDESEFEEGHKAVNLQQIENDFFNQNQIVRSPKIWRYLLDNLEIEKIKRLMELGLPYWAESFQGKWPFDHEEDKLEEEELQENDSESGTIQYQKRERFSKEQSFFLINQFIWEPSEPFFLVVIWLDFCLSRREWFPDANSDERRSDLTPSVSLSEDWVNKQEKHLELLTRRQRWQRRLRINSSLFKGSFPSHILFESYQYLANLFLSNEGLLDQMIKTLWRNRWLFPEDMNRLIRGTGKRFPIPYP